MGFQKTPSRKSDNRGRKPFREERSSRFSDKPRTGGFGRSFERKPFERKAFGKPSGKNLELFDATCAKCGKPCQVPFRPTTGGKPVLCRECFRGDDGGRDYAPRKDFSAPSGVSASELAEINEKLDKIIKALNIE